MILKQFGFNYVRVGPIIISKRQHWLNKLMQFSNNVNSNNYSVEILGTSCRANMRLHSSWHLLCVINALSGYPMHL